MPTASRWSCPKSAGKRLTYAGALTGKETIMLHHPAAGTGQANKTPPLPDFRGRRPASSAEPLPVRYFGPKNSPSQTLEILGSLLAFDVFVLGEMGLQVFVFHCLQPFGKLFISCIWSDSVHPANLWGCFVVAVAFAFLEDRASSNQSMFERRLISLIFAGRDRIILIRRELPSTSVASPAKPVA